MSAFVSALFCGFVFLAPVSSGPLPFHVPTNLSQMQNFQLPAAVRNPNLGLTIEDSVSLSVDPNTGEVNLAGGVSQGFGLDAGILTKSLGNSVTFTSGKGVASGSGMGSANGNMGAQAFGNINAFVPQVGNGLVFSNTHALTNSMGQFGRGTGQATGTVG